MRTGKHKNCKIVGTNMGESNEKKTLYFSVEFINEQNEYIDWVVWLTENQSDNAKEMIRKNLETLAKLGWKGSRLSDMADGSKKISDLFGPSHDVIVVEVEEEPVTDKEGAPKLRADGTAITRQRVKYVNVGEGGLTKFDHKTAVAKFSGLRFDGLLAEIKSGLAAPKNPQQSTGEVKTNTTQSQPITGAPGQSFASDDIPF